MIIHLKFIFSMNTSNKIKLNIKIPIFIGIFYFIKNCNILKLVDFFHVKGQLKQDKTHRDIPVTGNLFD